MKVALPEGRRSHLYFCDKQSIWNKLDKWGAINDGPYKSDDCMEAHFRRNVRMVQHHYLEVRIIVTIAHVWYVLAVNRAVKV
jgi:hypothetical protein